MFEARLELARSAGMPRTQKLKVYCTPIGFHNAYVAAPNQKAALEAWGSDANLFARGVAEQVTDSKLMAEPLAQPGKVIRKLRGTAEEHVAALPADRPNTTAPRRTSKPKPRPSRAALDKIEQALAGLEERQKKERQRLSEKEVELARQRHELETRQANEREALERQLDGERKAYARAVERWQD